MDFGCWTLDLEIDTSQGGIVKKNFAVTLLVLAMIAALAFLSACGGGGGDSSSMALTGTWVTDCYPKNSAYAWEKYVFDGRTGELEGMLEEFQTSDCSDPGVILQTSPGTYSTGSEIDCPSGWNGKCTELDMTREGSSTKYTLYSVFEEEDPDHLFLGSGSGDPATRADDVDLDPHARLRNVPCPGNTGEAITGLTVIDGGISSTPPAAPADYTNLPIDLNGGTVGTYVWLYYRTGRADGLEGTPIGRIYTVHESDGETPLSSSDTKINVNLNGSTAANNFLWLYYSAATTGPVVRSVVVANETDDETLYGPPAAQGLYSITWVEELDPGSLKTPSGYPQPPDAQDLNEGFGVDWIFLGYGME